jgi:protoheme IX farnesyltransferase
MLDIHYISDSAEAFSQQMPHFMALAYMCKADYAAGGYRMLSLGQDGARRVAAVALRNSIYMLPLGGLAAYLNVTSPAFGKGF